MAGRTSTRSTSARTPAVILAALTTLALAVAACSGGSPSPEGSMPMESEMVMESDMAMESMDEEFAFGHPADAAEADRTIEIVAHDNFTFDPDEITVTVGETITFSVRNPGAVAHEIVLGPVDMQREHEEEMQSMGEGMTMHDEPNAVTVESGETKELTWTFTQAGTFQYGCHEQPAHYANGMFGTITVTE